MELIYASIVLEVLLCCMNVDSFVLPLTKSKTFRSGLLGVDSIAMCPRKSFPLSMNAFMDDVEEKSSEENLKQVMSNDERKENLSVMRQIFKYDLADLQRRRDYAGWVEAKKDLKQREAADPWFSLNKKLKDAVQMDEEEEVVRLKNFIDKLGGPPPGVKPTREYAVISEIYDTGMSLSRAENIARFEQTKRNSAKWLEMVAERKKNEVEEEEEYIKNPYKAEEEARLRREKTMRGIYLKIEERRKKAEEKAKEIQSRYKDAIDDNRTPLERALAVSKRAEEDRQRRSLDSASLEDETAVVKKEETKDAGRPRLPGDVDVTRGEVDIEIQDSSDVTTDNVRIQVSSSYNSGQSDPPMRKHCFQYTIKITNLSEEDTIQLVSRRFEIQTVGAKQKDIVQGQGVTGRQPLLKPGETFEYTSTAPLSVRPIGTTIIAARMRGTYTYVVEKEETTSEEQKAQLGMFHFIFPMDQRVKPVTSSIDDDDDDEDEELDTPATSTMNAPAPSLPGDADMESGKITIPINDSSSTLSNDVDVSVTTQYREERSDPKLQKHCFAYNIRITNESPDKTIQLISRRFVIQTISSSKKDVVHGPGVTGRQPILKPGESFEYTSTAPLNVKPLMETPVVARMEGEYNFVILEDDKIVTPDPLKAKLGMFHFVLPQVA